MRLVSFSSSQIPRAHLGILHNDEVLDVDLAGRALGLDVPDQVLTLIEDYDRYLPALQTLMEKAQSRSFREVKTFSEIGAAHTLNEVRLAAPIPRPRKNIYCLAVNYKAHAEETASQRDHKGQTPDIPVFFTKSPTSVNDPYGEIELDPQVSSELDWEVELGVIIGKRGKNIPEAEALSYVFGYTVLNDVTARDLQKRHKQFFKGKSLDGSCPMGPCIVTADEIADPHNLNLSLRINGETKQDGNTKMMIFNIKRAISVLSQGMTLEPGDILATGTPSGVGFTRVPPEFLQEGDVMESEVEGIGVLRNLVVAVKR
ncbi:fumarylacetoacetate hydrolase family protein [Ktedonobacter racemifer]|uniref:5-carboxymethyl-2-hydroxymuconateDelta-isomerase n=1 Tax=Ktedonobacter racemifer DSM 44963 TaxID=485913 RepID=D6TFR3_KTERA|nr:fumarylacetoacetate hydrolase family protein [Ktedonobacter racemifer]EFH90546.1 5-carboxymethyl-2-hydroxymuconateDelta-isomerase [Ktedonobacter racemifer DSM 44963]